MKHRVYKDAEGVKVVTFAPNAKLDSETEEAFIARVWAQLRANDPNIPEECTDVESKDLPDRTNRKDWDLVGGKIEVVPK